MKFGTGPEFIFKTHEIKIQIRHCGPVKSTRICDETSSVATGNGGVRPPPTSVQTPLGISANPLKSFFFTYRGVPHVYIYCNFYCSPGKKHGSDPPTFLGLATPLDETGCEFESR